MDGRKSSAQCTGRQKTEKKHRNSKGKWEATRFSLWGWGSLEEEMSKLLLRKGAFEKGKKMVRSRPKSERELP